MQESKAENQEAAINQLKSNVAQQEALRSIIARQQKQIDALTSQIQKVNDQLGAAKPVLRVAANNE